MYDVEGAVGNPALEPPSDQTPEQSHSAAI